MSSLNPEHQRVCQAFGQVLKAARAENGISQEALAQAAGMDRSYESMLERGKAGRHPGPDGSAAKGRPRYWRPRCSSTHVRRFSHHGRGLIMHRKASRSSRLKRGAASTRSREAAQAPEYVYSRADTVAFGNPFSIRNGPRRTPLQPRTLTLQLTGSW